MTEEFYIRETAVAMRVGVSRDRIKQLRDLFLKEGVHWEKVGKPIKYSEAGLDLLRQKAALPLPEAAEGNSDAPEIKTRPSEDEEAREPVTLKVFRTFAQNNHILEAHAPDKDPAKLANRWRVRVKDASRFVRGMEIPCELIEGDFYRCLRQPRSRGRM